MVNLTHELTLGKLTARTKPAPSFAIHLFLKALICPTFVGSSPSSFYTTHISLTFVQADIKYDRPEQTRIKLNG